MVKAGDTEKQKFQIKHARAVLAVVFSCSFEKKRVKEIAARDIARADEALSGENSNLFGLE